jgi:hypothetical protein
MLSQKTETLLSLLPKVKSIPACKLHLSRDYFLFFFFNNLALIAIDVSGSSHILNPTLMCQESNIVNMNQIWHFGK